MVPVLKKEDGNRVKDYRGVTLAGMLYKVYAEILAGREEVERKRIVSANQSGFTKRRRTMDIV